MAKCTECKTDEHKTLFDYNGYACAGLDSIFKVWAIPDDGEKPEPSGFCHPCFIKVFGKEIETIANKRSKQ